ncbi:MAG: hypothetical protein J1F11_06710 [Oscillospiraceae bacterium]|nr:hypothetical protein [Oscillospiraceae bacterium]
MKLSQKLLIIAKGIGLWWGIYLILGCCVGFALKMAMDLFMLLSGVFELKRYLPPMVGCTLVLAVITYFVTEAVKLIPKSMLRRRLQKKLGEEGFSDGFTAELLSHATGDNKNHMLIEAASAYCVRGEILAAEEALHRTDLVSILDIAQSTGKLRTAAYYYCTEMTLCILKSDKDGAAHVYDEGSYYLEAFPEDDRVLTVLAIYQTTAGLYEKALETLEKITWSSLPKKLRRYGEAVRSAIEAVNLADLGRNDEAIEKAKAAILGKCSKYVTELSRSIIDRAENAQKEEEKEDAF